MIRIKLLFIYIVILMKTPASEGETGLGETFGISAYHRGKDKEPLMPW